MRMVWWWFLLRLTSWIPDYYFHCTCETAPMCRRTVVYQSMEDSHLGLVQTCEQEMGRERMWKSKKSCNHGSEDHGKVVHMWNTGTDEFRIRSQIWSNDVRSIEASKQFDSCQEKEGLGCVKPKLWVSENGLYGCYTGIRYTLQISRLFRRNTMINPWILGSLFSNKSLQVAETNESSVGQLANGCFGGAV